MNWYLETRKIIFGFIAILLVLQAEAQEFWMQADKFIFKSGEIAKINFLVGEGLAESSQGDIQADKLLKLELYRLESLINLKINSKENLEVKLNEVGTQLIYLEAEPRVIIYEGGQFNERLKEDGLDEVLYYREQNNQLDKPVKESVSIYTKLLFQVGTQPDKTFSKIVKAPLEILINQNPCTLKIGDAFRLKILFQGKPLFGAKVRIWNNNNNMTTTQNIFTLQDGTVETHVSAAGPWLVSVVNMIPSKISEADWQSFRSTLVFGIK